MSRKLLMITAVLLLFFSACSRDSGQQFETLGTEPPYASDADGILTDDMRYFDDYYNWYDDRGGQDAPSFQILRRTALSSASAPSYYSFNVPAGEGNLPDTIGLPISIDTGNKLDLSPYINVSDAHYAVKLGSGLYFRYGNHRDGYGLAVTNYRKTELLDDFIERLQEGDGNTKTIIESRRTNFGTYYGQEVVWQWKRDGTTYYVLAFNIIIEWDIVTIALEDTTPIDGGHYAFLDRIVETIEVEPFYTSSVHWYEAGTYTVGENLEPGEYFVLSEPGETGSLAVGATPDLVLHESTVYGSDFVTVEEGEVLTVTNANFCAVDEAPGMSRDNYRQRLIGTYRVGTDVMQTRDYGFYIHPREGVGKAIVILKKDSRHTDESLIDIFSITEGTMLMGDYNDCYITMIDQNAFEEMPTLTVPDGLLPDYAFYTPSRPSQNSG